MSIDLHDRVAYSPEFCRSIGAYTGDIPFARGTVLNFIFIGGHSFARIDWGNPAVPGIVAVDNLTLIEKVKPCTRKG